MTRLFALQDAELEIAGAVDVRANSAGARRRANVGIPVWTGAAVIGTAGRLSLHGVRVRPHAPARPASADLLCVSGGINPAVHLASQSGTPLVWDDRLASFVPGIPVQAQHSAGAAAGITGIAAAAADGARAGSAAATAAGFVANAGISNCRPAMRPIPRCSPLWEIKASGKAFVDIQDDVTTEDIRLACREGYRHIEHAKRYTTHTMGTEQGKTGGLVGAAVLAEARGERVRMSGCRPSGPSSRRSPGAPSPAPASATTTRRCG